MVRLRAAGLCVLPLKGILNICTKCSEWDIKFSLYNERASAVEVATNSEKMSRCTVKLVNTAQDTLKMALYKRSIRFLHASRKNWWSLKINTELYNIFNTWLHKTWLNIKSACTILTRQSMHSFSLIGN